MSKVYIYVVDRDLGFAPNPFHGLCTLATCKPRIRNAANIGDWVIGVGGNRLNAKGRCVFAMRVSRKVTYNQYWEDSEFTDKKPVRNGSKAMLLGDNIYHRDSDAEEWQQEHSHHSNPDGSLNIYNKDRDTKSSFVLLSNNFYYFGSSAPVIPEDILKKIGYENGINHRVYGINKAEELINWLEKNQSDSLNMVMSDPFNFDNSEAHYSVATNKLTK